MKYIVLILVVSAVVAQMAQAEGFFNANLNGSVSGSIQVAGHYMNFTGEIRPKRHAPATNGTAASGDKEQGHHVEKNRKGKQD